MQPTRENLNERRRSVTTKADYTAEEWELLLRAPLTVGMAVIAASPSGPIGVIQEMSAIARVMGEARPGDEPHTLISALIADVHAGHRPGGVMPPTQRLEDLKGHALATCQEVSALLARKAPASEADGFKRWLITVAHGVAEAAKEGGVLGIGGVRVSAAEQALLAELAAVLEVAT
jgi:hypothetical protein